MQRPTPAAERRTAARHTPAPAQIVAPSVQAAARTPYSEYDGGGRFRHGRARLPGDQSGASSSVVQQLTALPYFAGSVAVSDETGYGTFHDPERAWQGLNLYTSGHTPGAFVMDMDGHILHTWHYDIADVWPDRGSDHYCAFWRRAHWFPNGDLLAIFEGIGMLKLDRHSNLLWAFPGGCHHHAFVTDDDRIYVLTRERHIVPRISTEKTALEDKVAVLTLDGELLDEFSLVACLDNSPFDYLLDRLPDHGDLLHTNSVFVFDGSQAERSPLFRRGNVLVSMLVPNTVAIVNPEQRRVVWAMEGLASGLWRRQHEAVLLDNGNMLLFDNWGDDGDSRIVEFEPLSGKLVWQYAGVEPGEFHSRTCGTEQRLPNGNTLAAESDMGRAFEVTPQGEIVWEYHSPHRAGQQLELVATLFEMRRVPVDWFPWLAAERQPAETERSRTHGVE
jgi:hypothetical protein